MTIPFVALTYCYLIFNFFPTQELSLAETFTLAKLKQLGKVRYLYFL